jgi:four helix bundle protein
MAQRLEDLQVWNRAIQMSVAVYKATASFPKQEMYGLSSQLQRAAVSVASNIAEGRGRLNNGEFRQFLGIAQGSNYEVQTQIVIARTLAIGDAELLRQAQELSTEVGRMLSSFIASVSAKS